MKIRKHLLALDGVGEEITVATFLSTDLFETMVFLGGERISCECYGIWEEAEEGHKRVVLEMQKRLEQAQALASSIGKEE